MTRSSFLLTGIVFAGLLIAIGLYFNRELNLVPVRIAESDDTMLKTDSMRHAFKVSLLSGRAYQSYLAYIHTGDPKDRQHSINLGKAAVGFASSVLSGEKSLAGEMVPIIQRNVDILEASASREEAAAALEAYRANMHLIYRGTEHIEQDIWTSFQQDFVRFQTNEQRASIAYQLAAALAIATLLIVIFFFLRQRRLLRLIEAREADLQAMIELRNKELALLRETQAAAQAADRAKTEFLALMSHELRTPLNAIVGFSEIVKSSDYEWVSAGKTTEYASAIHSASLHLLHVINDILDLTKIEAGETVLEESLVDLQRTMQRAANLVRQRAQQKRQTVELEVDKRLPALLADERLVFQILINLLSNAVKFTGEGGQVVVFAMWSQNGGIDFGVRDTGSGIPEADIPIVMQPFAQLRRHSSVTHEGTGLGLPLSRRFAELHGATITIESELDVGTTVTVHFPPERAKARAVPERHVETAGPASG